MNDFALSPSTKTPAQKTAGAPSRTSTLKQNAIIIGIALAAMWGLEIIDAIVGQPLNDWGVVPRTATGLLGIPLSPLLHGGFPHLVSNTIPFAVLAFFTLLRGPKNFAMATGFIVLVGGLLVWLMGRSASHIGASGLIFGYFGYLLAAGFFERSLKSILLAVLVGLLYGGMIFGVLPSQPGVSWEGHLFGALAGGGFAWLTLGRKKNQPKKA
jgi:membrane associated rhomboid family serine protease